MGYTPSGITRGVFAVFGVSLLVGWIYFIEGNTRSPVIAAAIWFPLLLVSIMFRFAVLIRMKLYYAMPIVFLVGSGVLYLLMSLENYMLPARLFLPSNDAILFSATIVISETIRALALMEDDLEDWQEWVLSCMYVVFGWFVIVLVHIAMFSNIEYFAFELLAILLFYAWLFESAWRWVQMWLSRLRY
jgi:hypothetical protein